MKKYLIKKKFLEKGKTIENDWKNNNKKLSMFINDCIDIENIIEEIHLIQKNISKWKSKNVNFTFFTDEENGEIKIISEIKIFGEILTDDQAY